MKVGGVPEHYNAPVKRALQDRYDAEWITYPSGTGAMLEALENGELDMAIVLTEGVVKHALSNSQHSVEILGTYLDNPLSWGVHVSVGGGLKSLSDVNEKMSNLTFGVSRMGSGSHLMAIVHASTLPSGPFPPKFKVVNTMAGARDAMVKGEIDVFLWDVTTADIYTREGDWTCVGTVSGDWPAFVFVIRSDIFPSMLEKLVSFIDDLRTECRNMTRDIHDNAAVGYLRSEFSLSEDQARNFLENVKWNCSLQVEQESINRVLTALVSAGIITNPADFSLVVPGKCRLV